MAKLARNAFIEKHKKSTLIGFDFADFRRQKPSATQTKKVQKKAPRLQLVRPIESATGKVFPTPNQIITALAKNVLKSDYFIESGVAGTVQALHVADDAEAKALAEKFPHGAPKPGNGKPAKVVYTILVDAARAEAMARQLKLL